MQPHGSGRAGKRQMGLITGEVLVAKKNTSCPSVSFYFDLKWYLVRVRFLEAKSLQRPAMSGASHKTVKAHRKGKGSKPRREDELLPTCEGPKMHPFRDPTPDIEFLRLLSVHSDDVSQYSDESGGTQGHVFLATVNAETFALKLVGKTRCTSRCLPHVQSSSILAFANAGHLV